jgi:hypothetical protein
MKSIKQQKSPKDFSKEELDFKKPKKKNLVLQESKINVKSKKFWEELYDNEGEEIQKYIR